MTDPTVERRDDDDDDDDDSSDDEVWRRNSRSSGPVWLTIARGSRRIWKSST